MRMCLARGCVGGGVGLSGWKAVGTEECSTFVCVWIAVVWEV